MYEPEVNDITESIETLPEDIRRQFAEHRDRVTLRSTLPWGEHCTECVWPTCYTTCDLYSARPDGACRQFVDGMVRIDHKGGLNPYILKIRFKRWGKLWTVGNLGLRSLPVSERREWLNIAVGAVGRLAPLPTFIKPRVLQKISYVRKQTAESVKNGHELPDAFLLECYNPNARSITVTFSVRPRERDGSRTFQTLINLPPGYTRARIAFAEIAQNVNTSKPFELEITPNDCENTVLYFGLMDFVKEKSAGPVHRGASKSSPKMCKCIVWDLDNTIWDGTLMEDGPEGLRLRPGVVDVIKQADQRGILHSIASKNNYDEAIKVLKSFGIDEYFLYPQVGWHPKSQSIAQIAQLLNIGTESLAFVDDQAFEREEVKVTLPQTTVLDSADYAEILKRPEFCVPVTAESTMRRRMYREQEQRQTAQSSYQGDYQAFLRDCHMRLSIRPLDSENLGRIYELAQRTNQMNFSGSRYTRPQLSEIMGNRALETFVIDCSDRFGAYGIVGFAIVDSAEPRLLDLMFSCRIQGKRVEHAVLSFLLNRFNDTGTRRDFYANFRRTAKNAPSGKVFDDVGFEAECERDGVTSLVFRAGRAIPDDHIIDIDTSEVCR